MRVIKGTAVGMSCAISSMVTTCQGRASMKQLGVPRLTSGQRVRRPTDVADPWGLTRRQQQVMDELVSLGCKKSMARAMGVDIKTVEAHMGTALRKMDMAGNRVLAAIAWDRFRRAGQ